MISTELQGNYTSTKTESIYNSHLHQNKTINKPSEKEEKNQENNKKEISISPKKEKNFFCFDQKHFTGEIDIKTLSLYEKILTDNIKSFTLIINNNFNNDEKLTIENSLKAKSSKDAPSIEIILKTTTSYEKIEEKFKEFFNLFGELFSINYDLNSHTVKVIFKYYFSATYANKYLKNICQKIEEKEDEKQIMTNGLKNEVKNEKEGKKNFDEAFNFLTNNYNASNNTGGLIRLKSNILKEDKEEKKNSNSLEKNIDESNSIDLMTKEKENKVQIKKNNFPSKIITNIGNDISFNKMGIPPGFFLPYNNRAKGTKNIVKIPVAVPIPVPVPYPIQMMNNMRKNRFRNNFQNFRKVNVENTQNIRKSNLSFEKNNSSMKNFEEVNDITSNYANYDSKSKQKKIFGFNDSKNQVSDFKSNTKENLDVSFTEKKPENLMQKNETSQKQTSNYISNTKLLSLERLNNFLQNEKPVSAFNNPIKKLAEKTSSQLKNQKMKHRKNMPMFPMAFPIPMMTAYNPYNAALFKNFYNNKNLMRNYQVCNFDKNVIDFEKLTLDTKNKIRFNTRSTRDYSYKYVSNYLVQIVNDDDFEVTKNIIGKNGCFLKKIIHESCIKYGDYTTKIRLRGQGSGYLEEEGKESDEPLMLCVSSLNYYTYQNCCQLVEKLLDKIYADYYMYLLKSLPVDLRNSVQKKSIRKQEYVVDRYGKECAKKNESKSIMKKKENEEKHEKNEKQEKEEKKENQQNEEVKNEIKEC